MSAGKHLGGITKIFYNTTVGFGASSVQITGLWSGTSPGEAEVITGQDAAGRNAQTGVRIPNVIFSTAVTAAFVTNIIAAAKACTELYFKYYYIDGNKHVYGPNVVRTGFSPGNTEGLPHRLVITHEGFTEDVLDQIDFTG